MGACVGLRATGVLMYFPARKERLGIDTRRPSNAAHTLWPLAHRAPSSDAVMTLASHYFVLEG
jgi:hypothetical protein